MTKILASLANRANADMKTGVTIERGRWVVKAQVHRQNKNDRKQIKKVSRSVITLRGSFYFLFLTFNFLPCVQYNIIQK
jgi:hypothetical protein